MDSSIHAGETNADRKRRSREAAKDSRMSAQKQATEMVKRAGPAGIGLAVIGSWIIGYYLVHSHQLALAPFSLTPAQSDGQEFRDYYGFASALLALPFGIAGRRFVWGKAAIVLSIAASCCYLLVHSAEAFYQLSLG
jgi:hypothetical protein